MLNVTMATLLALAPAPMADAPPAPPQADAAPAQAQPPQLPAAPVSQDPPQPVGKDPSPATADAPPTPEPAQSQPDAQRGDVLVTGRRPAAGDPLRALNTKSFAATEAVDRALIGPISMAYAHAVPSPIRRGVHNFLYNLREPLVFVNFMLQLKPGKAAETVGRFAVNSTIGVGGVLDVAKRRPFRLPRRANGFADTLGYYGVHNGVFLFLPITGPTTVRDLIGGTLDRLLLPLAVGKPFTSTAFTAPVGALGVLDHRADFDPTLHKLHDGVADPYAASRDFYLARRQAEIDHLHGRGDGKSGPVGEAPVDSGPLAIPPKRTRPTPHP